MEGLRGQIFQIYDDTFVAIDWAQVLGPGPIGSRSIWAHWAWMPNLFESTFFCVVLNSKIPNILVPGTP